MLKHIYGAPGAKTFALEPYKCLRKGSPSETNPGNCYNRCVCFLVWCGVGFACACACVRVGVWVGVCVCVCVRVASLILARRGISRIRSGNCRLGVLHSRSQVCQVSKGMAVPHMSLWHLVRV